MVEEIGFRFQVIMGRAGKIQKIENFPFKTDFDADVVIVDLKKNSEKFAFGKEYVEGLKSIRSFKHLPKTLIHTDISPMNTIQKNDGSFIVIDWDEAGIGTTILDAGQPLINQFISEDLEFHQDVATSFYKSYFREYKLGKEEMVFVFDAALFWACMYIIYGDTPKRWKRIQWALKNKDLLESVIRSCEKPHS